MTDDEERVIDAFDQLSEAKQNILLSSLESFQDWIVDHFGAAEAELLLDIAIAVFKYLKRRFGLSWFPW